MVLNVSLFDFVFSNLSSCRHISDAQYLGYFLLEHVVQHHVPKLKETLSSKITCILSKLQVETILEELDEDRVCLSISFTPAALSTRVASVITGNGKRRDHELCAKMRTWRERERQ